METSSLGTKADLSVGKAAEVSPCNSLCSGERGDGGRDSGYPQGARALVPLKELTVTGPLGWVQPAERSRIGWAGGPGRRLEARGWEGSVVYYLHVQRK